MASYAYGKKPPEKKRSPFASAFLKVALAGILVNGSYQHYVPEGVKEDISGIAARTLRIDRAEAAAPPIVGKMDFVFENQNQPAILGEKTKGVFFSHTNIMDEWFAAQGRHAQLLQNSDNRALYDRWLSQLDKLKGLPLAEKARGVDALVDQQIQYALDPANYGKNEYWASPMETLQRGRGDCEDFAILKYHALRYLGVPADKMFIVAVSNKGADVLDHATLMVDVREAGMLTAAWEGIKAKVTGKTAESEFVILDNDGSEAGKLVESRSSDYKPYYAMNEKGVWAVPTNSKLRW
ncbi:MAG: transglutaminase-like cysteine peptidase [Parvibaculum sp.]|uniref:transglutaminase-like cysteine peptidase n=1 Tax=Parvibaculum sp. TaxID=2024848 RepID=UPI00272F4396|nr:transglutaminase-like cysteine peptidase [Parvibaculum sp.]MDP2148832.1 transglutaminase-like cysteine peptidase [Parvibaculum sp.]